MIEIISSILPIALLIGFGILIRRKNIISAQGMHGIRYMVVNVCLACVLFNMFRDIELDSEMLIIFLLVLLLLALMMLGGRALNLIPKLKHRYNPYMSSCCAFSLIGLALFSILYGEQNMAIFSVIGLAHEIFVWTFYMPVLRIQVGKKKFSIKELLKGYASPILISIMCGLLLNFTGIGRALEGNFIYDGIIETVSMVAPTATPMILILVGYGININKDYIKQSVRMLIARYIVLLGVGIPFKLIVIDNILPQSPYLDISYISLLLIPPIFSLPILVGTFGDEEGEEITSNAVAIGTIVGLITFVGYAFIVLL